MTVPFTAFRFEVVLDLDQPTPGLDSPLCDAAFAECEGLEMSMEPKTIESASVTNAQQYVIGKTKYGQVILKRGMTSNLQLWQWFSLGTRPGSVLTAHGQITLWDSTGSPALQVNLAGCLPVRMRAPALNAASGLVAVEELSLVCAQMTMGLPGQSGGGVGISASVGIGASASIGFDANASLSASASAGASFSGGID
ncbi:MAG TPA: phage tail protein [Mycobacteriales bacterium]|jgi:phage tail-like protein|nr:phage tail protein [Mycobacteriales bacterium]